MTRTPSSPPSKSSPDDSSESRQVPMSEASIRAAAQNTEPPWPRPSTPVERFDNRMWYITRADMLGTYEEHELEALRDSARARLEHDLNGHHKHRKVADQYLSRIRRQNGQ